MNKNEKRRIGIFAGSFDPVHKGHIGFACSALKSANLDAVYFLPEAQPRHKSGVTHLGHRISMLKLATRPYRHMHVLDLPDKRFTVSTTLPRLRLKFPNAELLLLVGSDVLANLHRWPNLEGLLDQVGLVISIRRGAEITQAMGDATNLPRVLRELHIVESLEPSMSSRQIRQLLRAGHKSKDTLESVNLYILKNWLYASIPDSTA